MVKCEICQKEYRLITKAHLKYHNYTVESYLIDYPLAQLVSDEIRLSHSIANIKSYASNTRKSLLGTHPTYTDKGKESQRLNGKRLGSSN